MQYFSTNWQRSESEFLVSPVFLKLQVSEQSSLHVLLLNDMETSEYRAPPLVLQKTMMSNQLLDHCIIISFHFGHVCAGKVIKNKINGCIPFKWATSTSWYVLTDGDDLLGHLLLSSLLFLLWHVKISAMTYFILTSHWSHSPSSVFLHFKCHFHV